MHGKRVQYRTIYHEVMYLFFCDRPPFLKGLLHNNQPTNNNNNKTALKFLVREHTVTLNSFHGWYPRPMQFEINPAPSNRPVAASSSTVRSCIKRDIAPCRRPPLGSRLKPNSHTKWVVGLVILNNQSPTPSSVLVMDWKPGTLPPYTVARSVNVSPLMTHTNTQRDKAPWPPWYTIRQSVPASVCTERRAAFSASSSYLVNRRIVSMYLRTICDPNRLQWWSVTHCFSFTYVSCTSEPGLGFGWSLWLKTTQNQNNKHF